MAKTTMTGKELLITLQQDYNDYQNYRRRNNLTYDLATTEDILDFGRNVLTEEEAKQLMKCYLYQRKIQQRLGYYIKIKRNLTAMKSTMKEGE